MCREDTCILEVGSGVEPDNTPEPSGESCFSLSWSTENPYFHHSGVSRESHSSTMISCYGVGCRTHVEAELPTTVMVGKGEDRCGPSPEAMATISITLVLLEEGQEFHELDTIP